MGEMIAEHGTSLDYVRENRHVTVSVDRTAHPDRPVEMRLLEVPEMKWRASVQLSAEEARRLLFNLASMSEIRALGVPTKEED